jgi:hypothetical protein
VQINWTLVAGFAACSLAAAANWDAGTAVRERRGPWRVLACVYLVLLAEQVADTRFGAVAAIDAAMPGANKHAVQLGLALAMLLAAAGALVAVMRVARRMRWFAVAGLVAVAMAGLFGVEVLAIGPVGVLLYRPVGSVMLLGWVWLAIGAAAVGVATMAVRVAKRR